METQSATTLGLCREILAALDTPVALKISLMIKYGEWGQLVDQTVNPMHYDDLLHREKFRRDKQAVDLLRKSPGLKTGIDTKAAALTKWFASEDGCRQTNSRIKRIMDNGDHGYFHAPNALKTYDLLSKARAFIRGVLGAVPNSFECRFGPGATFESRDWGVRHVTVLDKILQTPTMTGFEFALPPTPGVSALLPPDGVEYVHGARFCTVLKNAKTDRAIAIEPGWNVWTQLGVGAYIRKRLKYKCGIDLDYGQDHHIVLARAGSVTGYWATIDLSSASDTIATQLVRALLPHSWFTLLDQLRSKKIQMPNGEWISVEKFSAMGNGFTFELETLIFAAICHAAADLKAGHDLFVYGDDIIVPTACSTDVIMALREAGFTINEDKTFVDGAFRESCGGDFFNGTEAKTAKISSILKEPRDYISLYNGLVRFDERLARDCRRALHRVLPKVARLYGPHSLGDSVMHTHDQSEWTVKPSAQSGLMIRTIVPMVRKLKKSYWPVETQYEASLYGVPHGAVATREIEGYKFRWVTAYGLGVTPGDPTDSFRTRHFTFVSPFFPVKHSQKLAALCQRHHCLRSKARIENARGRQETMTTGD